MRKIALILGLTLLCTSSYAARYCGVLQIEEGVHVIYDGKFDPYIELTIFKTTSSRMKKSLDSSEGKCRCVDGDIVRKSDPSGAWEDWNEFYSVQSLRMCGDKGFKLITNN